MSRDTGIRNLIPGYRDPDEIKEDENTRRYVETIVDRSPQVTHEPLRETLVRTTPSLNLRSKPKDSTKEPESFISKKEYENHLINSPTKQDHQRAFNMGDRIIKASAAEKNKMADQWMTGGGREKGGRSLDQEIKISKNILHAKTEAKKGGYTPWYERMAAEAKEKEEEDPRTEGRMEALQKIEDKGKSWFVKHLKKSQ